MGKERVFIFEAKGVVSGTIEHSSDSQVKEAIKSAIAYDGIGEIEIGEDGGASPEFDAIFGRNCKVEVKEVEILIRENPCCEHCGHPYTDFGAEVVIDSVGWCLNCVDANDELPEELLEETRKEVKTKKKKHYKNKLKELEEDD